jgi:hypothetical protein
MGIQNFELPFIALAQHLWQTIRSLFVSFNLFTLSELLAPISLTVQAAYLLKKPRFDSAIWRMGIVFAGFFFFVGSSVLMQQLNYTRAFLPLSIAFNLVLMRSKEKFFGRWFLLGNLGLTWINLTLV